MKTTQAIEAGQKAMSHRNRDWLNTSDRRVVLERIHTLDSALAAVITSNTKAHDRIDELEAELEQLRETYGALRQWVIEAFPEKFKKQEND